MAPLKERYEQKSKGQNMSSFQCKVKEVSATEFHKRRREAIEDIR